VIYVGAGTSGRLVESEGNPAETNNLGDRLGILDASEIPPTFAAPRSQFIGLIAGGDDAIRQAQEGAEDNEHAGEEEMKNLNLDPQIDSVIGIASSGRTPYVMGCLAYAQKLGCVTIGVVCVLPSAIEAAGIANFLIAPLPGPEVVTGSTRLKAGTVTKLVLNMLSTGTMIRTGKTYGNMVSYS
jgi:N-acetylmuramic acid 6-phosphate etherase